MAAFTDFAENKLIDFLFRAQALTAIATATAAAGTGPATLYIGLLTTADNDADSAKVEVSGGSYARVAVTSSLANWAGTQGAGTTTASSGSSGTTSNNNTITFPAPTANWGTIVGAFVADAAAAGNVIAYSSLTVNKTVNNGDAAPSFAAGALTFQIDN
jgi:hypothetical protein